MNSMNNTTNKAANPGLYLAMLIINVILLAKHTYVPLGAFWGVIDLLVTIVWLIFIVVSATLFFKTLRIYLKEIQQER